MMHFGMKLFQLLNVVILLYKVFLCSLVVACTLQNNLTK